MSAHHDTLIRLRAPDPTTLFQRVLDRLCPATEGADGDDAYVVGFAAVAADTDSLLAACLTEVGAIAVEEDAQLRACEVSGVMGTDEGQRAWGFVTLAPGPHAPLPAVAVVSVAQVPGEGWVAVVRDDGGGA